MEWFSRECSKMRHLSMDSENLNKQTKPKLGESLMITLTARQLADSFMKPQSEC